MIGLIDLVVCRFLGRRCTPRRPASKDLIAEMADQSRKTEAKTIETRKLRERMAREEQDRRIRPTGNPIEGYLVNPRREREAGR